MLDRPIRFLSVKEYKIVMTCHRYKRPTQLLFSISWALVFPLAFLHSQWYNAHTSLHVNKLVWQCQHASFPVTTTILYPHGPDNGDKLAKGQLLGNQELGFVEDGQILLLLIALHNYLACVKEGKHPSNVAVCQHTQTTYRDFVGKLCSDVSYFILSAG